MFDVWVIDLKSGEMFLARGNVKKSFAKAFAKAWKTKRASVLVLPAGLRVSNF